MAVTAPAHLEKQPGEARYYSMDFSNLMVTGETIQAQTVVSELRGGGTSDLTINNTSISGQTVIMKIAGGTDRHVYRVQATITTSGDQTLQGDGILKIKDKG